MIDVTRISPASLTVCLRAVRRDYISPYVNDLDSVVDMQAIAASDLKIGVDPLGGSGIAYWASRVHVVR